MKGGGDDETALSVCTVVVREAERDKDLTSLINRSSPLVKYPTEVGEEESYGPAKGGGSSKSERGSTRGKGTGG